ncbi:hypothetical protein PISMIDRAFT_17304 [Pisolithus microcarpus 441]|uniref:Uncharacterized protein n=1 Tax=Pisolithus microcarpus 441 TaxID=765257 RepID=A0A0C9Z2V9_9AGAM|nr:hypothetical protein PISMIDRAFT_17304 [Pisolithus microcarpus 441]
MSDRSHHILVPRKHGLKSPMRPSRKKTLWKPSRDLTISASWSSLSPIDFLPHHYFIIHLNKILTFSHACFAG